ATAMDGSCQKEIVDHGVVPRGGGTVVIRVRLRVCGGHLISTAHRRPGRGGLHCWVSLSLSKRKRMRCLKKVAEAGPARGKGNRRIAHECNRPRHVERCPDRDSITKMFGRDTGIVCEVIC